MALDGHDWQREKARKVLDTETEYEVEDIDIGSWSSELKLKGIEETFNTVMFKKVENE